MAKPFYKMYGSELLKTMAGFAQHVPGAELAKGIGSAIGLKVTEEEREATERQNRETQDKILEQLRKARQSGNKVDYDRWSNIAKNLNVITPTEDILKEAPTTKQIYASGAELALIAATGYRGKAVGLKPGQMARGFKLKGAIQGARATKSAQQALKLQKAGLVKKALVKVGKPVAKEAAIGAGFFSAMEATERDSSVRDIIKAGETGALVGGALATGAIGLGAGMGAFKKYVSPKIAQKWQGLVGQLEKTVAGKEATVSDVATRNDVVQKTLSYVKEPTVTKQQKLAQGALWGIKQAGKFQARMVDRFHAVKRVQNKLETMLGRPLAEEEKIHRNFRLADATAEGKAEVMLTGFMKDLRKYSDIQDDYTAYLTLLDFYDRAKLGKAIPGAQSIDNIANQLKIFVSNTTPAQMKRLGEVRKIVNDHNVNLLKLRVDAGLISEGEMAAMTKTHPNYLPHDVILDFDDIVSQGVSGSMNVPKTDLMHAIGSARNIKDPIEAMVARTNIAMRTIERNKILGDLVRIQEIHKVIPEMRSLVTSKQVLERRQAFRELSELKAELARIKDGLKLTGAENKALNVKILEAEKKIEELFNKGLAKVLKEGDEQLFNFIKGEIDRPISLPVARTKAGITEAMIKETDPAKRKEIQQRLLQAYKKGPLKGGVERGELTKVDVLNYGQVNVDTFNRLKRVINANPQLTNQAKAKLIVDVQKGLASKGKVVVPQNITGSELAKDLQVVIKENREAAVTKLLAKYKKGKLKGVGLGQRKTTAFGLNRKILEKKFDIFKTEKVVQETEGKLSQLFGALDTKKKQIGGVVEEIQALAKGKKELGEQTMNLFRDGIQETWVVPDDVAYMIKNLDQPLRGWGWKIMTGTQKIMKKLSTQYNLSFALPNKIRDKQTAALTANAFIEQMAKKTGVSAQQVNLTSDEILKLYKESGGMGASIFAEGEHGLKMLEKKGLAKRLGNLNVMNPVKAIDVINQSFEQSTRLDVFQKGLARGLSPKDAAMVSREATIDFSKMGQWMRPINQFIPFSNARLQGMINIPRAFVASPEIFARMQFYTSVLPTLYLHRHNSRFESYKNISQYYKNRYYVVMTGEIDVRDPYTGNMTKIPQFVTFTKGEGQQIVANPIQYYLERAEGIDPRSTKEMITDVIGSASPMEFQAFESSNWLGTVISQFGPVPTIAAGLFSGKHPFFGSDIIPAKRKDAPKEMQYKPTTPGTTRALADAMGVAPANLEFFINAWGGVPQDLQKVIDVVYQPEKIKETTLTETPWAIAGKYPLLRRFLREATEYYAPEASYQRQQKKEIETEVKGKKLLISDQAEKIIEDLNRLDGKEAQLDYINDLGPTFTKELKEKVLSIKKYRDSVEALRKNDPVEVRAKYIHMRLQEMQKADTSKEEVVEFLDKLTVAKILTKQVKEEMLKIKATES